MRRRKRHVKKDKQKKAPNKKKKFNFLGIIQKYINWQNISIGKKYLVSFSLAAILFLVAGTIVYFQLSRAESDIQLIEEESIRSNEIAQLALFIQTKDVQIADYIINQDQKYLDEYEALSEQFIEIQDKLETELVTEQQQALFNQIVANNRTIDDIFLNKIMLVFDSGQLDLLTSLRDQANTVTESTVELVDRLIAIAHEEQSAAVENANMSMRGSIVVLIFANLIAISLGILVMVLISRTISTELRKVVNITTDVANGNLVTENLDYEGKDEIGQLANAINQMKEGIRNIVLKVADASQSVTSRSEELTQSAHEVNEGADQISSTMQELSSGTESQAISATDLSENMSDFVKVVRQSEQEGNLIAENSNQVRTLTAEGTALMNKSVEQMKRIDNIVSQAVSQVQGLDKQSHEISHLVQVIKDIADQTNLLSLNAAIEAARAGEHGRGFAVVADEVRKLSEQVTTSVTEITGIVTTIRNETNQVVNSLNSGYEEVKEGTEQIVRTGDNFVSIDNSIADMSEKIVSISKNLQNIANRSDHMNTLIQDIASVSEESAAGVEQAAATIQETSSAMDEVSNSANELAKLAEQLNDEIKAFKLN